MKQCKIRENKLYVDGDWSYWPLIHVSDLHLKQAIKPCIQKAPTPVYD